VEEEECFFLLPQKVQCTSPRLPLCASLPTGRRERTSQKERGIRRERRRREIKKEG
jgi:hypothetical protein